MNPLTISDALNRMFSAMNSNFWTTFLLAVAGLGTLTMAILQAIKDTTPLRQWFQKCQLSRWLELHAKVAQANHNGNPNYSSAMAQIVQLATDGDPDAFFNLEIEKMCGQWNSAIQIVLDSPHEYPDFFSCVAARALHADFDKVYGRKFPVPLLPNLEAQLDEATQVSRLAERQAFVDARTRVSHQVQRAVDSFQIVTSFRWKWSFQIASFLLSFGMATTAMKLSTSEIHLSEAIIWGAVAGFLAPVARDLLAAIQKLRN